MKKERFNREIVAMRVARELQDGDVVNLGIGMPTLCSQFIPEGRSVVYHSESGVLGYGPMAGPGEEDIDLINAGGQFLASNPGMSFFNSVEGFAMIRGGHIDVAVLGALQVSERGDLANWMLPERGIGNVGGAMDLAFGAKRIIVAMEHSDRNGNSKIVRECDFPLTAPGVRQPDRDRRRRNQGRVRWSPADRSRAGLDGGGRTGDYRADASGIAQPGGLSAVTLYL